MLDIPFFPSSPLPPFLFSFTSFCFCFYSHLFYITNYTLYHNLARVPFFPAWCIYTYIHTIYLYLFPILYLSILDSSTVFLYLSIPWLENRISISLNLYDYTTNYITIYHMYIVHRISYIHVYIYLDTILHGSCQCRLMPYPIFLEKKHERTTHSFLLVFSYNLIGK